MKTGIQPLIIGAFLDVLDYILIGSIPIIGDIVDLIGVAYFWRVLGPFSLAGLIELMPAFDILPTYTFLGILAYLGVGRR